MVFNDTSTRQGLIQDCEDNLSLGATGISGNTTLLQMFTRYINNHYHKVVTMILDAQDDFDFDDANRSDYPSGTFAGTTNRDYTFGSSAKFLKLKKVSITYDGTTYYTAQPLDSGVTALPLNQSNIDTNFSSTEPFYDTIGPGFRIYPKFTQAQVDAGAKVYVEFFREPTEFTTASTTTEPGFDEPFHRMLSLGASLDYAIVRNLNAAKPLSDLYADFERRLKIYYGKKNNDTRFQLKASLPSYE